MVIVAYIKSLDIFSFRLSSERPGDYKECFNMMRSIKGDVSK